MRFLLYNIRYATGHKGGYHLPLPFTGFFKKTEGKMDKIVDFIELIDPDIIGLLEVDQGSYRSSKICQAAIIADRLDYCYLIESKYQDKMYSKKVPVLNQQSNALLSKPELHGFDYHYFSYGIKRLIIRARLDQLTIFLVHLSLKFRHRQHQLEELHKLINNCETEHVMVAGDFNTFWGDRELGLFLAATGLISANPDNTPSHPSHSPSRQLDFILHSPGISIQSFFIPQVQLSDHMPLVCDFTC